MSHTVLSLLYQVRLAVNDLDTNHAVALEGKWLRNADYNGFINRGTMNETERAYSFRLKGTGLWICDESLSGNPYALRFASDTTPFTELGTSTAYVTDCFGSIQTTATDTTATYSITASKFNFALIMSELFFWLAQTRAIDMAKETGAYVSEMTKTLLDSSDRWQGIIALGANK
jgi:hypothetical protein